MKTVMWAFHYRCKNLLLGPLYSTDLSVEEADKNQRSRHSVILKAFPENASVDEILDFFKQAHERKAREEIVALKNRIAMLERRIDQINNGLELEDPDE